MANTLKIELGWKYILDGNIYRLEEIDGPYFILRPLKINGEYENGDGGLCVKAVQFARAEVYGGEILKTEKL
jgi:hypothetical protein